MKTILCYGDSNTWGYMPATGARFDENTRWTGVLQRLLGENCRVVENGLNSRQSAFDVPGKPHLNAMNDFYAALISQKPLDALVIMLGTNDLKLTDAKTSAEGVAKLVEMAQMVDTQYPSVTPVFKEDAKILVISPIEIDSEIADTHPEDELSKAVAESCRFPEAFENMCRRMGVDYLNAAQFASPSRTDGVHMDKTAHCNLARAVAQKLQDIGI